MIIHNIYSALRAIALSTLILLAASARADSTDLALNDSEYFEAPGLNVLVFSNWYDGLFSDAKISGVELVHHGVRTATNGDVRLNVTPEQWDAIPQFKERQVDAESGIIEAFLHYPGHEFDYSVRATPREGGIEVVVNLPRPLPEALVRKAGFNLEFIPSAYFHRAFMMDGKPGSFPVYPGGVKEINDRVAPTPLAQGSQLVLAPEDAERRVRIVSEGVPLSLYDARTKAQNGWFVVRSEIPAGKSGDVIRWQLNASTVKNWTRSPMIAHSQVGYHPGQKKVAVIELDARDKKAKRAELIRIAADGSQKVVHRARPDAWGEYLRYHYRQFDFTEVTEPGLYKIRYGNEQTHSFAIAEDVYANAWEPTLDVFFPVQMDHMTVEEAYRVWHGASHLDDALQAPVDHEHFDLYAQGPTTDTPYEPGKHIPGLNIGGWYDAGDYDIRTQSQYATVLDLVAVWENFRPERDTTSVDYDRRHVQMFVADGKPDILQQIEHGTLGLVAQHRALGRAIPGIVEAHIEQYTHLGDGVTKTDNLIYDAGMDELETDGFKSGKFDDRWAFTSKTTPLNYGSIAALAAASRALSGYNDELAEEALGHAKRAWDEEAAKDEPDLFRHGNTTGGPLASEHLKAAVELLITTGEDQYAQAIQQLLPQVSEGFAWHAVWLVRAMEHMSSDYRAAIKQLVEKNLPQMAEMQKANPFGVIITEGGWAGAGAVIRQAVSQYYLHQAFPDLVDREGVLRGLNFLYGTHPAHNLSLVSGVGTRSKEVAYGVNRADFSFIAGGIVPGILVLKPDLPENREDWPFFWGQNEYVITLGAPYIFLVHAAQEVLDGAVNGER